MGTFNIDEISRQSSKIKIQTKYFRNTISHYITLCQYIAEDVKADDTTLCDEIYKLALIYNSLGKSTIAAFTRLAQIMDNYVNDSIKNEEALSAEIRKISSEIEVSTNVSKFN